MGFFEYFGWILVILLALGIGYYTYSSTQPLPAVEKAYLPVEIVEEANNLYASQETEFAFCLDADVVDGYLVVRDYTVAKTINHTKKSVQAYCPRGTTATLHSHPSGICQNNPQDAYTLGASRQLAIGIICGENEIHIYPHNNLEIGVEVLW